MSGNAIYQTEHSIINFIYSACLCIISYIKIDIESPYQMPKEFPFAG